MQQANPSQRHISETPVLCFSVWDLILFALPPPVSAAHGNWFKLVAVQLFSRFSCMFELTSHSKASSEMSFPAEHKHTDSFIHIWHNYSCNLLKWDPGPHEWLKYHVALNCNKNGPWKFIEFYRKNATTLHNPTNVSFLTQQQWLTQNNH